jgi:nicotinate-nucleotide adenylyltransferase
MSESRKIALFGGTFDPVHHGHIHLARSAREKLHLDEVRFLPCRISPHKLDLMPTSAEDRLEMLRLATANLPWAVVDDFEIRREGPSYSWQTAEAMAEKFPGTRLFWIMGGDQWRALSDWAEPRRLAACVEFIVCARGETPMPQDGCRLHVLDGGHPASATKIREAISRGQATQPWLDPAVSRWIRDHRIYQNAQ